MASNNCYSHTGSWVAAAENIGAGFATAQALVNAWMANSGMCQDIMTGEPTDTSSIVWSVVCFPLGLLLARWIPDRA